MQDRKLFEQLQAASQDQQKDSSVTIMQNSTDDISKSATKSSTPNEPQTKPQETTQNPHQTTQEEDPQTDKQRLKNQPTSQPSPDIPHPPTSQTPHDPSNPSTPLTNDSPNETTSPPTTFHGWLAHSPTSPLTWGPFTPKKWEETDVDIAITHCGVCFSDLCTLRSGWGPTPYPVCVGYFPRFAFLSPPLPYPQKHQEETRN